MTMKEDKAFFSGTGEVQGFDDIAQKEQQDIQAWAQHADSAGTTNFLHHKLEKIAEARVFLETMKHYEDVFQHAGSILELGGGSCWASYLVKVLNPDAYVVGTDIAPAAIQHHKIWEDVFQTKIDDARACTSYETPFEEAAFDLIFCFEAAHHFGKHSRTFQEIKRLLKPGGTALYLHEPGCRRYIYPLAHRRVNRKRPAVPEDVLVYKDLLKLCSEQGLEGRVVFDPSLLNRGPSQTLYFMALRAFPFLQHAVPCTIDLIIKKPTL